MRRTARRRPLRTAAGVVVAAILLLLSAGPAPAGGPGGPGGVELRWRPCPQEAKAGFECAVANVPLDHADPGGRTIELGVGNSTVYNSSFRNTGDDALAVWASRYVKDPSVDIGHDNHFRNNTVQLPWRANGIAIYGGHGNTIENIIVSDTMNYPGIMLTTDHDPLPFSGQTLIANNALHRTGGAFWGEAQEFGAITLFAGGRDIPGVVIRDTDIHDSTYDGIQFKSGGGAVPGAQITNVTIDRSNNGSGIFAHGGARGSATLTDVIITGSAEGDILVEPGSQFVVHGGAVRPRYREHTGRHWPTRQFPTGPNRRQQAPWQRAPPSRLPRGPPLPLSARPVRSRNGRHMRPCLTSGRIHGVGWPQIATAKGETWHGLRTCGTPRGRTQEVRARNRSPKRRCAAAPVVRAGTAVAGAVVVTTEAGGSPA